MRLARVFPAYAGMSPSLIAETIASLGFPRLRGDEPDAAYRESSREVFSPPTRG